MAKVKKVEPFDPYICPFTKERIEVVALSKDVGFIARTSKWVSTIFTFREDVDKFLETRNGVVPERYRTPHIEARDREPPAPDPFADVKEKVGMLDDLTQEALR